MRRLKLVPKGFKLFSKKQKLKLQKFCCFAPSSKDDGGKNTKQQNGERRSPKEDLPDRHVRNGDAVRAVHGTSAKTAVAAKKPSIVLLSHLCNGTEDGEGLGIVIRKNIILTSHGTVPSVNSAKDGEMALSYPAMGCCPTQTTLKQKLLPSKFFITNPALDITAVACDDVSPVVPLNIELGQGRDPLGVDTKVYILGAPQGSKPSACRNLKVGGARVSMEGDSIVKFSTAGEAWISGSAGFTKHGEFSFMVCQPRRFSRAASMESSNSVASSSSQKRSPVKQSGVALHEILRWLQDGMPPAPREQQDHGDRDRFHKHLQQHNPKSPPPPEHDVEVRMSASPCYHHIESPRSCTSAGLNPRQPGISYPATPSTKSSPRCSPRRRRSPNPRASGVSYSVSPTRSITSAQSRRSSQQSSRRTSPCYRSPPCCISSGKRSPIPLSSCCLGRSYDEIDCARREVDKNFQDFLDSPEFEPPPCPLSGSSSEEEASGSVVYASARGRPRSVAATKKQIFRGPVNRRMSAEDCGASDGEVYLGVGYMKHTHVSRSKANQKVGLPGYAVWHH